MTNEMDGGQCVDSFTVSVIVISSSKSFKLFIIIHNDFQTNTGQRIPTICGENRGQHSKKSCFYILSNY